MVGRALGWAPRNDIQNNTQMVPQLLSLGPGIEVLPFSVLALHQPDPYQQHSVATRCPTSSPLNSNLSLLQAHLNDVF